MSYYVIADINFNNKLIAAKLKMSIEDYNKMLINKWNSITTKDDSIFVFGVFGTGLGKELKPIIEQLNGAIYIVNYVENKIFDRDRWKRLGIHAVWNCNFTYPIGDDKIFFPAAKKCKDDTCKYRILTEKDGAAEVYKNNQLSIEAKYWDYTPILLKEIPDIILRMKDFEEMEEN